MKNKTVFLFGCLAMAMVFLLPAGAIADGGPSYRSVKAHVDRADSALDRAEKLFANGNSNRGKVFFERSRRYIGKARRLAARKVRLAKNRRERGRAVLAQRLVAEQHDENLKQLIDILGPADGKVENTVARAALADTRGRDKALSVLAKLADSGVSSKAMESITAAMSAVSTGRNDDVRKAANALIDKQVSNTSMRIVTKVVKEIVDGQVLAANKLAELIKSLPEAARSGLQRAYDAVISEQEEISGILEELADRMPASIRELLSDVREQARENAGDLRNEMPSLPGNKDRLPGNEDGPGESAPPGESPANPSLPASPTK